MGLLWRGQSDEDTNTVLRECVGSVKQRLKPGPSEHIEGTNSRRVWSFLDLQALAAFSLA